MRKYYRTIAKARLKAMGVDHVNRKFGSGMHGSAIKRFRRSRKKRRLWFLWHQYKLNMPLWKQVLWGNLARDGYRYQMGLERKKTRFVFAK